MTPYLLHKCNAAFSRSVNHVIANDYLSFLRYSFTQLNPGQPFQPNWHIEAIAEYLNALERCELQRLIINMPPRSLKSLSTTVAWSSYLLGRAPSTRIITASYSAGISLKHATDVRALLGASRIRTAFPALHILKGQNEKHKFMTTQHGFRLATSVGGTLTGEGGDVIIIDDPLNPAQAMSRSGRELANHWFDHTLATRLNDKRTGRILLVMQRLHADDLSGHLLNKGGWEHLCLPARAEQDIFIDIGAFTYTMNTDELLQPQRESADILHQIRLDLGSIAYNAQYLQAPVTETGSLIRREWLTLCDNPPERSQCSLIIQSWDTAIKSGAAHDYSACATIGVCDHQYYLLDMVTVKAEYPELKRLIVSHAEAYTPDAILIEDKASGQSLLQDLRNNTSLALVAIMPKGNKLLRTARITPLLEAGGLRLVSKGRWQEEFIKECLQFPHGVHDDQVDAMTQALGWLQVRMDKHNYMRVL